MRSLAAQALLVGLPLAVLGAVVAIVVTGARLLSSSPLRGIQVMGAGLALGWTFAAAVVVAVRARPAPPEGVELCRQAQPALWTAVDALAAAMDVRGPDRIVVTAQVNAGVTEVKGHRELAIGLPLVIALTRGQLLAVVAHELGHFAHGDTRLTARTHRWAVLLEATVAQVDGRLLRRLLSAYADAYLRLARSAGRRQELAADAWSARLAGPDDAVAALGAMEALGLAWARVTGYYVPLARSARRRPDVTSALRHVLPRVTRALDRRAPVSGPVRAVVPMFASHPPTEERIALLRAGGVAVDRSVDPAPATALLRGGENALPALERVVVTTDDPAAPWDRVVERGAAVEARELLALVARAARATVLPRPLTPGALLAHLGRGGGRELVAPLLAGLPPEAAEAAVPAALARVVAAAAHVSLAGAGRSRHVLDWSGPVVWWVTLDGRHWRPQDLRRLEDRIRHDPATVEELRHLLADAGADLDHVIEAGEPPARQARAC